MPNHNYPGFAHGVSHALLLTALAFGLWLSAGLLPFTISLSGGVAVLFFVYLLLQLRQARVTAGRTATGVIWLGTIAIALTLGVSTLTLLGLLILCGWLARAWFQLHTPLQALFDLGLWCAAVGAGALAFSHTGSFWLSAWSLFLTLALWPALAHWSQQLTTPPSTSAAGSPYAKEFAAARDAAQQALQRIH